MDKIAKFLKRLSEKARGILVKIFDDIQLLAIESYDIKQLQGLKNTFRLRKGKIRIIFVKGKNGGQIVSVRFRKDAYRS